MSHSLSSVLSYYCVCLLLSADGYPSSTCSLNSSSSLLFTHATKQHPQHQTYDITNTPPPNPPFRPSSSRNPLGGRRVGAPRDIAGDAFEARVRAFLQGRFWELPRPSLDVTLAPIRAHEHPETPHDVTDPPPPLDPSAVGLSKFATLSE